MKHLYLGQPRGPMELGQQYQELESTPYDVGAIVRTYNGYGVKVISQEPGLAGWKYRTTYEVVELTRRKQP